MVFFTLATVIDLRQGKKVKYNLSKVIVYALGIGNMLEIIVWIENALSKVNLWKCRLRLESETC